MEKGNKGGFIIINRKLLEWRWNDSPSALALWVRLLLMANYKDGWFHGRKIPRGTFATSTEALSMASGLSPNTVKKYLKMFEDDGQIIRETTNKYTLITIVKYSEYQDYAEYFDQQTDQQTDQQSDQQTAHNRTNKQSNKYKEKYKKRKDVLPEYMTNPEYDKNHGNCTALGISNPEEIW